jgi:membrane associated rhomboid family serine protease
VAFFAHVGGFVFGFVVATALAGSGRVRTSGSSALRAPA